jgi:hypothetical protein
VKVLRQKFFKKEPPELFLNIAGIYDPNMDYRKNK